jgi:hypothetical protein
MFHVGSILIPVGVAGLPPRVSRSDVAPLPSGSALSRQVSKDPLPMRDDSSRSQGRWLEAGGRRLCPT